jgi:succinate-semialdehyde dehydrogenase / glutarate-semialdehyde dehydrogenase
MSNIIRTESFINGQWVKAGSGKTFQVNNPATGVVLGKVNDMAVEDLLKAIDAAHNAWPSYRDQAAKQRSEWLRNWYELLMQHKEELAELMSLESGKVISESRGEVKYGASFLEWFSEEARRSYGDVIPANTKDKKILVVKQAVGVVAAITPWNFPLAMITRKVAPALAAGCTVVIKPPSETPLTGLAIVALSEKAGFPPGVINIITTTDHKAIGKEMCENKKIRKLSFTGSTEVGKLLMQQSASTLKKLSLELGGNAPFIVFEDADIDAAVNGAITSKFRHNGQTCVCVNRILVQDKVYDVFVEKFTAAVRELKEGDVLDPEVKVGPLINEKGMEKVKKHIKDAVEKGGTITTGGSPKKGLFFQPTVIKDANSGMIISKEEVFGPVAPIYKFSTEAEAVKMANDTSYGLASYFYSSNVARCFRVAEALEYGMVGINEGLISTEVAPFGGIKESGFGREGSKYGMDDYMEIKYMCFGGM